MNAVLPYHQHSMTTLSQELHNPPTIEMIRTSMTTAFEDIFHTTMTPSTLTKDELIEIEHLLHTRYYTSQWNAMR